MKLLIAIPTKGRYKSIVKNTLRWVPRVGCDFKLFVESHEVDKYVEAISDASYHNYTYIKDGTIIDIGSQDKGYGNVMGCIKKYAIDNGYDLVFKIDDDIKGFYTDKKLDDDEMVPLFGSMLLEVREGFEKWPNLSMVGFTTTKLEVPSKLWNAVNVQPDSQAYIIKPQFIQPKYSYWQELADYLFARSLNANTMVCGRMYVEAVERHTNRGGRSMFRDDLLAIELEGTEIGKTFDTVSYDPDTRSLTYDLDGMGAKHL